MGLVQEIHGLLTVWTSWFSWERPLDCCKSRFNMRSILKSWFLCRVNLALHLAHVCMYVPWTTEDHRFVYCYANYLWSKEFDIVISINQNKWTWTAMPTQQMKWLVRIFQTSLKLPLCHLPVVYRTEIYEMCPKTNLGYLSFFFWRGDHGQSLLILRKFFHFGSNLKKKGAKSLSWGLFI